MKIKKKKNFCYVFDPNNPWINIYFSYRNSRRQKPSEEELTWSTLKIPEAQEKIPLPNQQG